MKPHLPKKLLVAVLAACSMGLTAKAETAATSYTLGDVMYVGDSITHGYKSASYRWALHKILVDNGILYNEVGYAEGNDGYTISDPTYRGVTFKNVRSAQSSQRAYNTSGSKRSDRLDGTTIQNWLGVSTVENIDPTTVKNSSTYTGSVSSPDTFVLMLGTNDLLSDYKDTLADGDNLETVTTALLGSVDGEGRRTAGDMGTIVDTMYASNPNATVYVTTIPSWTNHDNNNSDAVHVAVQSYNESFEQWVKDYNAVNGTDMVLVDVNRGLLDVASAKPFYGVSSMFRSPGTDGLHPNAQGELIIAGNMARAMGIAGRTAGLARVAAGADSFQTTLTGNLLGEHAWESVATGGFTAELMGFTLGNGETDGWNVTDNFSITLGNGSMSGTLDINEAYIQWNGTVSFSTGSTVLFSENMSALTENIRIAYHTGDASNNIASGFYVWLGDMLIGEALQGTESSANGVTLSYSGTGSYTLDALSMDATAAYAPTTSLASAPRVVAPAATAQGVVTVPTVADKDSITIQSAATGGNAMSGVSTTNADTKVATVSFDSTKTLNTYFANSGTRTVKDIYVTINNGQINNGWFAAHTSGTLTGNVTLILAKDYQGIKDFVQSSSGGSIFGVFKGSVTGNVTLQFDAVGASYSTYTSGEKAVSVAGAYEGNVSDTLTMVFNAGTFKENVIGGEQNGSGNKIGATKIYVNGGTFAKNLFGGGRVGTIGKDVYANDEKAVSISMTGGSIAAALYGGGCGGEINGDVAVVLTGGSIGGDIYGGGTAGTINGNTSVTIDGNLVALGGSVISGGGSGGTISRDSTVTIKNATASNYIRSIDQFVGTITGGSNVSGTSTLVFENSVLDSCLFADNVQVTEFDVISLKNSSIGVGSASITGTTLSISLTGDSTLTVNNEFTTFDGGLNIVGGSGSVVFAGAKNDIGGQLYIAAGNEFVLQTGSSVDVKNAIVNDGTLTLNGTVNFELTSALGFICDPLEPNCTENGFGSALVRLITGSGTLTNTEISATINDKAVEIDAATGQATVENIVYYVVSTPAVTSQLEKHYSCGNGLQIPVESIVTVGDLTVGDRTYGGPTINEDANSAFSIYVGENGTLCIVGDSVKMSASQIFTTTQGNGNMIVRAPGYKKEYAENGYTYILTVNDKTQFTGDLYLSPYCVGSTDDGDEIGIIEQTGVELILQNGADISSFNSVSMCHSDAYIAINGVVGKSTEGHGHIHNLSSYGAGTTYLFINQGGNREIVLSGKTTIEPYEHIIQDSSSSVGNASFAQPTYMRLVFNQDAVITMEELCGDDEDWYYGNVLYIDGSFGNKYLPTAEVNGVVNIESFDYRGFMQLNAKVRGSLHVNLNLLENQTLFEHQYSRNTTALGSQTLTITGDGTYILSEAASIFVNFGVLSTEYEEDGVTRKWRGTVEVNNLAANGKLVADAEGVLVQESVLSGINFADYGNEQSTVHFKGFKGHIFDANDNENITIAQDLILENSTSESTPHGFELSNAYSNQTLHFTGDISGTGDFVISMSGANNPASENIYFSGNMSGWKDGAELRVEAGEQSVTFQDKATEINAAIMTTGGTLNLAVDTAEGTTFTNDVKVSKLSVSAGSVANFAKGATVGAVGIAQYVEGVSAEVSDGMTISTITENNVTTTSIRDGKAVNANFVFTADNNNTVSDATLSNVRISSVSGSSVLLDDLSATNVYLHGEEVNFSALEVENSFYLVAATEDHNEVRFESDAFAGMTLSEEGMNTITLTVNNAVNWGEVSNENPNSVTIVLKGFTMEGLVRDVQVDGWLSNLIISGDETSASLLTLNAEQSATGTGMSVNELLAAHYDYVTYEQKADGLHIRMSNIPEPTTGTLSLLALAAIAARRRRR